MEYGFFDFLKLLGALGFFIYGMKVMSEGIQKAAGDNMRKILGAMTKNRVFGVLTGFLITGLVQSSSATTVMTVSFVNAGLLSLAQSAGVMMGANVGTTVTAWFLSLLGFKVKIAALALPIIAFGLPMMLVRNGKFKFFGEFLVGFALLFLGLDELKHSVPDIKNNPDLLAFLTDYADLGFLSTVIFVGIGTLLTILVQSSSAAMALTLVMCANGWIPFPLAAAMVLGENIGTTITAELASLVANVHAKRSARIHSLFNIIGVTWMMLFGLKVFVPLITYLTVRAGFNSPLEDPQSIPYALSAFHTLFNLTNVLLLLPFVPWLVKASIKLVKSKTEEDEEFGLVYIGNSSSMKTGELSLIEAMKEVSRFGKITVKMSRWLQDLLPEDKPKKRVKLLEKIKKYEELTDEIEEQVSNYLVRVSENGLSLSASARVRGIISITGDLERIADIIANMSIDMERGNKQEVMFTDEQKSNIDRMFKSLNEAFEIMVSNLERQESNVDLKAAIDKENEVNKLKNKLRKQHLKSVEGHEYDVKTGLIYKDLFFSCEKVADHIINVSEALAGQYSKDDEDLVTEDNEAKS